MNTHPFEQLPTEIKEQNLTDHYNSLPQSYRDVMDLDGEMCRDYHGGTLFYELEKGEKKWVGLNLCSINLSNEEIQRILSHEFKDLRVLNLHRTEGLKSFTFTKNLANLTHVNLSENESLTEVTFEKTPEYLVSFEAYKCRIKALDIPALGRLRRLDVRMNGTLEKLEFEGDLPKLEMLFADGNKLKRLDFRGPFKELVYLYANHNELEEIDFQYPLSALEVIDLQQNKLTDPNTDLLYFPNLHAIYMHGNPWNTDLATQIPNERGANSIEILKTYLKLSLREGKMPNFRVKMIIVGNGRVGKTNMMLRLMGKDFNPDTIPTHGIEIGSLTKEHFPEVKTDELILNVWDFGGQIIYHAIHQFFLSEEALYIFAWTDESNVREYRNKITGELPDVWRKRDYWLDNIKLHGKSSPILMVQTHIDKKEMGNTGDFEEKYSVKCLNFSAKKGLGLDILKHHITLKLNNELDKLGELTLIPFVNAVKEIRRIRDEKLNSGQQPVLSWEEFKDMGIALGLKDDEGELKALCRYLYRTGVTVYFGEDERFPNLKGIIYIDPNWLTDQVYKLLAPEHGLRERKGKFDLNFLTNVFPDYTKVQKEQFINLLKGFGLIYEELENPGNFIAPQYLPEKPSDETSDSLALLKVALDEQYFLRYSNFMPDNVMINFLSEKGPYSNQRIWRYGIFFKDKSNCPCIVMMEDPKEDCLTIRTKGGATGLNLQYDICEYFRTRSKNAKIELSLDGENFVSWNDLQKAQNAGWPSVYSTDELALDMAPFYPLLEKRVHSNKVPSKVSELKELICRGFEFFDEVLDGTMDLCKSDRELRDTIIMIKGNFKDLKSKKLKGVSRDYEETYNRYVDSVLEILNTLTERIT